MTEDSGTFETFDKECVLVVSMLVMVGLSLAVTGCLFWELCLRKLYRKPALTCNAHALTSSTALKSSLRKKKNCRKELSVRFSDDLESICLSDLNDNLSATESAIYLSSSYEERSVTESAICLSNSYEVRSALDDSEVFVVHAQASFSPYHLAYTTPRKSTDQADDSINLFNCEMSPVVDEPEIHVSQTFENVDEHKDSGHCADDEDDDDDNKTDTCEIKLDMFMTSTTSDNDTNESDRDKGIGSLETSPCFVVVEPACDVTSWPLKLTEIPRRSLSTPKPELDGSYFAPVNQQVPDSISYGGSPECSLTWDSYPYQERVDTSLSWDNFNLNRSKSINDVDNVRK